MKISCIAVDDEPLALELIKDYTGRVSFLKLDGLFESGIEVLDWLHNNTVDLIFLDIMMPEITGIQFMEAVYNKPMVIFTTAYEDYALKGFELDVVDYLLKPITFERFLKAVLKARERLQKGKNDSSAAKKEGNESETEEEYIFIRSGGHLKRIDFNSILYIEGMSDYLRIHTDKDRIMTLMNFQTMLSLLPSRNFLRVHRSYIINLKRIDSIESNSVVIGDKHIPISRNFKDDLLKQINTE
jgi:DNA-binding LytR/AlgR family response regulator